MAISKIKYVLARTPISKALEDIANEGASRLAKDDKRREYMDVRYDRSLDATIASDGYVMVIVNGMYCDNDATERAVHGYRNIVGGNPVNERSFRGVTTFKKLDFHIENRGAEWQGTDGIDRVLVKVKGEIFDQAVLWRGLQAFHPTKDDKIKVYRVSLGPRDEGQHPTWFIGGVTKMLVMPMNPFTYFREDPYPRLRNLKLSEK